MSEEEVMNEIFEIIRKLTSKPDKSTSHDKDITPVEFNESFKRIWNLVNSESTESEVKKKRLEFVIENLFYKFHNKSLLYEKLMKDEIESYEELRPQFLKFSSDKISILFSLYEKLCNVLGLVKSLNLDENYSDLKNFNKKNNDEKLYILTSCYFRSFINSADFGYNKKLNVKINNLVPHVFTRNDYNTYNFDKFTLFKVKQIKEILYEIGPEKCVLMHKRIFKQISDDKSKYDEVHSNIEEICRNEISSHIEVIEGINFINKIINKLESKLGKEKLHFKNCMERMYLCIICREKYNFLFKDDLEMKFGKQIIIDFMNEMMKDSKMEDLRRTKFFLKIFDRFFYRLNLTFIDNSEKNLRSDIKSNMDEICRGIEKFNPEILKKDQGPKPILDHITYMIRSFDKIFNQILSQIYISNDVKKNIFEFVVQYMYKEIYLERSYSHQTFLLYYKKNVIGYEKNEESMIQSFNNQRKMFIDGIDMKINYLMSEYLKLTVSLENNKKYSDETNEQKNYSLTLCIFDILTYKYFEGHKTEIDEIEKMKLSLFSRIDIKICQDDLENEIEDYCSNIKFELLNIDQIKEILDLIGPQKCARTHKQIFRKISDDKSKYVNLYLYIEKQLYEFVIDRNKYVIGIIEKETRQKLNHLTKTITNIFKKFIYIKECEKYGFENKLLLFEEGEIVISENSSEIKKNILGLISKLNDFVDFDGKLDFFELVRNLFKITDEDVSKLLFSDDEPKKKSKKKKSKKVVSEEVTDEMIDAASSSTDITFSTIDEKKKVSILSSMNDEIINKIRSVFFHENGIIFCNDDFQNIQYPKSYYALIIFNFIKPYLLFIISFILKNNEILEKNNINVILWGGACTQYFSKGKRKTLDLDFKIYSNKDYNEIKNLLESEILPYLSILNIKEILKKTKHEFKKGTLSDYQENLNNAISSLVRDDTNIELEFIYYEERHIIKFNANVVEKKSSENVFKIPLIDMGLNTLKGGNTLPRTDIINIEGIEIKIIKKNLMKTNLSNYQSDYENLKKMEQYVNSIITIVKSDDINTIKKNMRREGIRETDIAYFVNLVQTMKITSTKDEIIESLLTNEENKLKYFLPQYIQRVPTINFAKTIEFLGKKAQSQNMAILESEKEEKRKDEPIEEDGFNIRKKSSVRRRRSSLTRKKSSARRRRSSLTRKKSSVRRRKSKKRSLRN